MTFTVKQTNKQKGLYKKVIQNFVALAKMFKMIKNTNF